MGRDRVIILELELARALLPGDSVVFEGRAPYAEGFTLAMPAHEWVALGAPRHVHFIVSERPLGVTAEHVVRESR